MASNDLGGVWRTVGGRRIFIKDGQDLASAMKESGKFGSRFESNITIKRIIEIMDKQNEIEKELQQETFKTYEKITQDETDAMNFYTSNGYFDINDYLANKYDLPDGQEIVDNINNTMSKFEYNKDLTTYYGTQKYYYKNYKDGDIIDVNKFTSSSVNERVAGVFAGNEDDGLIIQINSKSVNRKGMYIGISSTSFSESEFLFSNEQKFKVVGRSKKNIIGKNFEVLEVETYG